MAFDLDALPDAVPAFLTERHLGALTTMRPDGTPHVVPVGFSYDAEHRIVRIITQQSSAKARHAAAGCRAAVTQIDGGRWLTLEGTARLITDPAGIASAVEAYAHRYQAPRQAREATRVAIEIAVDRIMGRP
jgi:PPOX class probable F420-dependent enzyme